jgi:hypothetical protein
MSDEKPVPETLETIAASIRDLRTAMDSRFAEARLVVTSEISQLGTDIDGVRSQLTADIAALRIDIAGVRSQLRADIESVRGDVRLVAEAFGSQAAVNQRHENAQKESAKRLDDHNTRILALERTGRGESPA